MRINIPDEHQSQPIAYVKDNYAQGIMQAALEFSRATYQHTRLTLREFEGARVRTAQINGCELCQTFRSGRDAEEFLSSFDGDASSIVTRGHVIPDEQYYDAVADWKVSPLFTDRERTAIEYAEGLGLDPQGIARNEDFWQRARSLFSDEELVDLSYCIASWIGNGRVSHALGIDGVCQIGAFSRKREAA